MDGTYEFGNLFLTRALHRRGWLTANLWTSESPSAAVAREEASMCVYRGAYIERHGHARTLRDMLAQEGFAMTNSGCTSPALDADDLAYTREAMAPP